MTTPSIRRNNNNTIAVWFVVVLVSISSNCLTANAWLPQRNCIPSSTFTTPSSSSCFQHPSSKRLAFERQVLTSLTSENHQIVPETTTSKKNLFQRKFVRCLAAGLIGMVLLPLRVSASTALAATEPAVAIAETAATAASNVAVPAAVSTTRAVASVAAAYCAAPPVPASVELKLTLRLIYAALLGAGLGKERSFAKHSAGVRTMALVAMGASAYTVCSAYGFASFGHYDPGRMASNVASGVGFVGAGVITTSASRNQNVVHGLTTAATIWLSAAVGVACGVGLFQIATTAAVATVTILRLGRMKPKKEPTVPAAATFEKQFIVHLPAETHADDDEDDFEDSRRQAMEDHYADTHDTSDWDEKQEEESPPVEFISHDRNNNGERIVVTEDADIGSIVEKAWRNSTDFSLNSTHFSVNVVPQKERIEEPSIQRRP